MEDQTPVEDQSREVVERLALESLAAGKVESLVGESPVGPHSPPVMEEVALAGLTEVLAKAAEPEQVGAAVVEGCFDRPRSAFQCARS